MVSWKTAKIDFSLHLITFNAIRIHADLKSIYVALQNIKLIKFKDNKNELVFIRYNFHIFHQNTIKRSQMSSACHI